jgi:hypothetical protein
LFPLCHVCHVSPDRPLKLGDFFRLILGIDAFIAEREKQNS